MSLIIYNSIQIFKSSLSKNKKRDLSVKMTGFLKGKTETLLKTNIGLSSTIYHSYNEYYMHAIAQYLDRDNIPYRMQEWSSYEEFIYVAGQQSHSNLIFDALTASKESLDYMKRMVRVLMNAGISLRKEAQHSPNKSLPASLTQIRKSIDEVLDEKEPSSIMSYEKLLDSTIEIVTDLSGRDRGE